LRSSVALQVFKQKGRATRSALSIATLGDTVGDLGNLKNRIGFGPDALELARAIERCDPLAEVVEGQRNPLYVRDDYKGFSPRGAAACRALLELFPLFEFHRSCDGLPISQDFYFDHISHFAAAKSISEVV
jgi:hypothetical protein